MSSYILHTPDLPAYLTIKIVVGDFPTYVSLNGNSYQDLDEGRHVYCEIHSTIHHNKVWQLDVTWSESFIAKYPERFRADIYKVVIHTYGLEKQPAVYS